MSWSTALSGEISTRPAAMCGSRARWRRTSAWRAERFASRPRPGSETMPRSPVDRSSWTVPSRGTCAPMASASSSTEASMATSNFPARTCVSGRMRASVERLSTAAATTLSWTPAHRSREASRSRPAIAPGARSRAAQRSSAASRFRSAWCCSAPCSFSACRASAARRAPRSAASPGMCSVLAARC